MSPALPSNPADLPGTPLAQLSAVDIVDLAARFPATTMDADLRVVANAFADAVTRRLPATDIERRWHHLIMTAGNFKRQAPINVGFQLPPVAPVRCPPFKLPGGSPSAPTVGPTAGYDQLSQIVGIGVPTASTIISVLWPDDHLIIDRLDLYTAVGLALTNRPGPAPQAVLKAWAKGGITWGDYEWLRAVTQLTLGQAGFAGVTLLQVEKALFELYPLLPSKTRKSDNWDTFVADLGRVLQRCPGCNVFGFQQHRPGCTTARCNTHQVAHGTKPCRHKSWARPAWQWKP